MQTFRITQGARARQIQAASPFHALCALTKQDPAAPAQSITLVVTGRPAAGRRPAVPSEWQVGDQRYAVEHVEAQALGSVAA
jgi:hypothetical protein